MKRPMTLTAAILGLVANLISVIMTAIGLLALIAVITELGDVTAPEGQTAILMVVLMVAVPMILMLLAAIFSGISIGAWAKDAAGYRRKRGIIITAIVFNFLAAILGIALIGGALNIILGLVVVAAAVLLIVDLAIEGKRVRKNQEPAQPVQE